MTIKFEKSTRTLEYAKCVRNVGKFKVYAEHFECARPYTNYYVVDTETGEQVEYMEHPSYLVSPIAEIVEQVREYGFDEPPAPQADPDAFDPLAY